MLAVLPFEGTMDLVSWELDTGHKDGAHHLIFFVALLRVATGTNWKQTGGALFPDLLRFVCYHVKNYADIFMHISTFSTVELVPYWFRFRQQNYVVIGLGKGMGEVKIEFSTRHEHRPPR